MKQQINGTTYNTETAEEIDQTYTCLETLYKTKKGAWFLHKECTSSETIEAFSDEEALAWLKDLEEDRDLEEGYQSACLDSFLSDP